MPEDVIAAIPPDEQARIEAKLRAYIDSEPELRA